MFLASAALLSLIGCTSQSKTSESEQVQQSESNQTVLSFKPETYTVQSFVVNGTEVTFHAYENIVYVENPIDEKYQSMNIYIPQAYFNNESIGDFTAETAPIFFPNEIGGYMPATPGIPSMKGAIEGDASRIGLTSSPDTATEETPNSILLALSKGYVVASPGARGRTNEKEDGTYYGKAPAAIVDLKAAVRYLHYNDEVMPGSADKIISNGTSAGGALSALLGASGNHTDYDSYLKALGAADASDAIFAVSSYCPITNLEHADMGYEWLFNGINEYVKTNITNVNGQIQREKINMTQTNEQITYSNELKAQFPTYLNSLKLKDEDGKTLTLDTEGNGSFKDYIKTYLIRSAQTALDAGTDLSSYSWVTTNNKTVTDIDFEGYIQYLGRSKAAPAFDNVDLTNATAENSLFGTETVNSQHFTDFSLKNDTASQTMASEEIIKLMNPMNYIGVKGADTAKYWRIRHGAKDSDTAISTPTMLTLALKNGGFTVDFATPWNQGHGGDYDLEELFEWINSIL